MWTRFIEDFDKNIEVDQLYTALANNRETYGPEHPRSVVALIQLALYLCNRVGNLVEGLPLYYGGLAIIEQSSAESKADFIHRLKDLARQYQRTPQWPDSPFCQLSEAQELYRIVLLLSRELYGAESQEIILK